MWQVFTIQALALIFLYEKIDADVVVLQHKQCSILESSGQSYSHRWNQPSLLRLWRKEEQVWSLVNLQVTTSLRAMKKVCTRFDTRRTARVPQAIRTKVLIVNFESQHKCPSLLKSVTFCWLITTNKWIWKKKEMKRERERERERDCACVRACVRVCVCVCVCVWREEGLLQLTDFSCRCILGHTNCLERGGLLNVFHLHLQHVVHGAEVRSAVGHLLAQRTLMSIGKLLDYNDGTGEHGCIIATLAAHHLALGERLDVFHFELHLPQLKVAQDIDENWKEVCDTQQWWWKGKKKTKKKHKREFLINHNIVNTPTFTYTYTVMDLSVHPGSASYMSYCCYALGLW